MGDVIFHLALADDWAAAVEAGEYTMSTRGRTLAEEGFIHCSRAEQAAGVAARFFVGAGRLVRLHIDRSLVTAPVVDDPVPGTDDRYPHIYGPLNLDAVIALADTDPERAADPAWRTLETPRPA
jgi:glutathione S-transferase